MRQIELTADRNKNWGSSMSMLTSVFIVTLLTTTAGAQSAKVSSEASPNRMSVQSSKVAADIGSQIRFNVEKFKLANGLTVVFHQDRSVPVISYQTWFRIGSKDEETGLTGIAHLFEHMMFKGAKRYTGEQFDKILQANGATNNAFTTHDYTGYYENLPSSKLELVIDIESDRMENLRIDADSLKSEREVVKEERRFRVDNNPQGLLREALFATAFRVHPYRWPVIGSMRDLDNVTVEKAQQFHRTYYAPNNAVVVVAGDFDSRSAKKLIEKYYGSIPSQEVPRKTLPKEPSATGSRIQTISLDVKNTQFVLAYHTPKAGTDEAYALDLLANILGNGDSSRLHQRMVYKDQFASSVVAYNMTLQDSGLFQIYVNLKPGADLGLAERAVRGEMWRPANLMITAEELQKAKHQVMKSYVDSLKTIHGKAEALALNEILFNDYEQLFKDLERYAKVTPEQIRQVAQKFLGREKSFLVVLKPKPAGAKQDNRPRAASAPSDQVKSQQ
jgi:zinc protease